MLKKISCDLFKIGDQPRSPTKFHMELNTILGAIKGGAGSIGNSTMMLIIDFVFGGNSYGDSDAAKELDPHIIYSTFQFGGTEFHLARRPDDAKTVLVVDEHRKIISQPWEIAQFTTWLVQQYGMDLPGVSFRNTLSRFFRIYGKNNHSELKPLQTRSGEESQREAMNILIALFEYYKAIEDFETQLQNTDDRIGAFRAALRYEFIHSAVDGMTKYKANIAEIAVLEQERSELAQSDETSLNPAEVENANERNALKRQLGDIRRAIKTKQDELHLLDLNLRHGAYPTEADLVALREFFPDANLKKFVDIEEFHTKIQTILSDEPGEAKIGVERQLEEFGVAERDILSSMDSIPASKACTDEFPDACTSLDRIINKLKDENEAFDTCNVRQNEKQLASDRYHEQVENVLADIEIAINNPMEAINDEATGSEYNAPKLTLNAYNSYTLETPKDKGTGGNHHSMIIYDPAVMRYTVLPAVPHDSIVFDSMPRSDLSNVVRVYNDQIEKQIFISVDKTSKCTQRLKPFSRPQRCPSSATTNKLSSAKSGVERNAHENPLQQTLEDPHRQEHEQSPTPRRSRHQQQLASQTRQK